MKELKPRLIALVDTNDSIIGYNEKLKVHEKGLLHRAFSIFIFNKKGELLLQQRALHKYHSPGLWTNTCCSHLFEGMTMDACVHERLQFEMGFDTNVQLQFKFTYREQFENGLIEHETDHVFFGTWNGVPKPNANEVASYKWVSVNDLLSNIKAQPANYTYWLKYIIKHFIAKFE